MTTIRVTLIEAPSIGATTIGTTTIHKGKQNEGGDGGMRGHHHCHPLVKLFEPPEFGEGSMHLGSLVEVQDKGIDGFSFRQTFFDFDFFKFLKLRFKKGHV
jgi:hypothetical protein